jgi:hypothetical protein
VGKYRATAGREANIFFAMLACIANAARHTIAQRGCISFAAALVLSELI